MHSSTKYTETDRLVLYLTLVEIQFQQKRRVPVRNEINLIFLKTTPTPHQVRGEKSELLAHNYFSVKLICFAK